MLNIPTKKEQSSISEVADAYSPYFIPYACHYNAETILTKNGNLLQVIEIRGFSHKAKDEVDLNIRKMIRNSLSKNIHSTNIAIYFHTIRQARNLDSPATFKCYFAEQLHASWVSLNHWNSKYVNNLYITLISTGNRGQLGRSFAKINPSLADVHKDLCAATNGVLNDLKSHGAVKLSIVDRDSDCCSELVRFFNKVMHIEEKDFPVSKQDISKELKRYPISFGYNEMAIQKQRGTIFSAIFSIKDSDGIASEILGSLLQLPYQMVITQAMTFIDNKLAQAGFKHQSYISDVSRDKIFAELSGLDEAISATAKPNAFCRMQTTIMITSGNLEKLRSDSIHLYRVLCDLGILAVKEDLNLENCFWSQLPGNFTYNERICISLSSHMGSFALLNNCPFGNLKSKWGDPVTLLTTSLGTPYFFHFHPDNKSNGHTLIVGDSEDSRVMIRNFLFSEASKLDAPFIYIDAYKKSELFLRSMGVKYSVFNFEASVNQLRLNPLLLEDKPANRKFLRYWFLCLLNLYTKPSGYNEYVPVIDKAVDLIFSLPQDKRRLSNAAEFFADKNSDLTQNILSDLQTWHSHGSLAHIFDNDSDFMIENLGTSFAFDMSDIYDTSMRINLPILIYILHFYREYFTGHEPSILCVSWSNRLFNSIYFEKNLNFILEDLAKRNAVCLFTASFCSKQVNWSETVGRIYNKHMATKIFMSDNAPSYPNLVKLFDFEPEETMYLQSLSVESNQFLLKQGQNSTVMTLDLSAYPKEQMILTGSEGYVSMANNLIAKYGADPKIWLPTLYEQIDHEADNK